MADTDNPTNAQVVAKLDQILRELDELRRQQQRLSSDVAKLVGST